MKIKARLTTFNPSYNHPQKGNICVEIGEKVDGIEIEPGHFFIGIYLNQIQKGKTVYLTKDHPKYDYAFERYPELLNKTLHKVK